MPTETFELYIHESMRRDVLVGLLYVKSKVWPKVVQGVNNLRKQMDVPLYSTNKEEVIWMGVGMERRKPKTCARMSSLIN